jgi:hypothetical protein
LKKEVLTMPEQNNVTIVADTEGGASYLAEIGRFLGLTPAAENPQAETKLELEGNILKFVSIQGGEQKITFPCEPSQLLMRLQSALSKRSYTAEILKFDTYSLRPQDGVWLSPEGDEIRLTEKEVAILVCLYEAEGKTVERQTLLDSVWGYAETAETHTLETHIYRLRQKIEKDSSNPKILVTNEFGYAVSLA